MSRPLALLNQKEHTGLILRVHFYLQIQLRHAETDYYLTGKCHVVKIN